MNVSGPETVLFEFLRVGEFRIVVLFPGCFGVYAVLTSSSAFRPRCDHSLFCRLSVPFLVALRLRP